MVTYSPVCLVIIDWELIFLETLPKEFWILIWEYSFGSDLFVFARRLENFHFFSISARHIYFQAPK